MERLQRAHAVERAAAAGHVLGPNATGAHLRCCVACLQMFFCGWDGAVHLAAQHLAQSLLTCVCVDIADMQVCRAGNALLAHKVQS